ncbi:hypothetical protein M011DRAFT_491194 [Sporormia fimetaria CBS 119925]|uniref:Uncharacterized protein n=1 Tax=Sporormia fimetaria CBS 119925 TaxID=1340428 RepID=A0A6A6UX07_9PLEO|nr:hypothetical protein M011DRAFT_491194 [Sporormia fimetaria CBS 119925]
MLFRIPPLPVEVESIPTDVTGTANFVELLRLEWQDEAPQGYLHKLLLGTKLHLPNSKIYALDFDKIWHENDSIFCATQRRYSLHVNRERAQADLAAPFKYIQDTDLIPFLKAVFYLAGKVPRDDECCNDSLVFSEEDIQHLKSALKAIKNAGGFQPFISPVSWTDNITIQTRSLKAYQAANKEAEQAYARSLEDAAEEFQEYMLEEKEWRQDLIYKAKRNYRKAIYYADGEWLETRRINGPRLQREKQREFLSIQSAKDYYWFRKDNGYDRYYRNVQRAREVRLLATQQAAEEYRKAAAPWSTTNTPVVVFDILR